MNASFGLYSLTRFTPGTYIQREKSLNINLACRLTSAVHQHMGAGVEWRDEQFLGGCRRPDRLAGPLCNQGFSIGADGFSGFSSDVLSTWQRSNYAAYIEYEVSPYDALLLGAASRYEDHDSFGSTISWGRIGSLYIREAVIRRGVPPKSITLYLHLAI